MIIGTAGLTSAISVSQLVAKIKPSDGKVIVSGASGGVGSVALMLLNKLGYVTVAVSGKETESDYLKSLGVSEIIPRNEYEIGDKRPMLSAQYAGGIDTVGGTILVNILKAVQPLGIVTTCGSVSSTKLEMTVFPFILRGITLTGVSAQNSPMCIREELWNKLSKEWKIDRINEIYSEIALDQLTKTLELILLGKLKGRTIVNLK
jgi:putative YhdH/YhfP family quinone oxidoreductase